MVFVGSEGRWKYDEGAAEGLLAAERIEGNVFVEAFLTESGCWIRLFNDTALLRHGDAMAGSLE